MARSLLFGTSVSPGIAIGVLRFAHNVQTVEMRRISPREVEGEQEQLRAAVTSVRAALQEAMAKVPEDLSEYREVIAAQIELARDPKLVGSALSRIEKELVCAAWALDSTVEQLCSIFRNMDMDFKDVRAVITAEGGPTSHTAILSRGLHIPALVGVTGLLETGKPGEKVIVDGLNGCLLLDPDADDLATYEERQREYQEWEARTRSESHWPAEMRDGVRVSVHANLERLEEMDELQASGAEGVGLYRTEFSFLREHLPSEEELYAEYSAVARKAAPAHVVFRTLDAGADKMLRAQEALKEPNPALGLRGIRFCLRHQKIFRSQLRALMRAGVEGNVSLLLPMISGLAEVQSVRRIMQELQQELQAAGLPHAADLPLGIMVETPAAVLIADALARECDFFSIGTNDLIHYLMAIDRNNLHVGYLNEALHPAVVRSLKRIIDSAHREGIGVSVCGELAADPYGLALLLGMGVDTLSASPRFVPGMKHMIRRLDAQTCMDMAHSVLMSTDVTASQRMLRERLQESLGSELAFHTTSIMTNS